MYCKHCSKEIQKIHVIVDIVDFPLNLNGITILHFV